VPAVSVNEFLGRLAKGKPLPAILLLGDERYLRDACRRQIIESLVPAAARDWAMSRYSAARGELQAALERAQTLPMLAPRQVVFLEDAEALEKLGDKNREVAVEMLERYFANPAPFTVFVVESLRFDERMKLAKMLRAQALVVATGLGDDPAERRSASAAFAWSMIQEQGCTFESGAAEDLAESVAGDLLRLQTEIDKLVTHVGSRTVITRADVGAMVLSEKTATVWELADLLASRKTKEALEFLNRLLRDGEEPPMIVGAIAWMYRKLIEASELRGAIPGWQAARSLGMSPAQAELAIRSARKMPREMLLASLGALRRADDRLKGGGARDAEIVMEFLAVELTAARP
jgi:DNA polymerase-3 subunit delta